MKSALAAAILWLGISQSLPARADTAAAVRKTLQALYNRSSAAVARKDLTAAMAMDAPDYIYVDDKGVQHTLAESRQRAQQLLQAPQTIQATAQIDSVILKGKNATANVRQHLVMKWVNPATDHVFVTEQWTTSVDQWVKQGATWRRTRSQVHTIRVNQNGHHIK